MSVLEIVLLLGGLACFAAGFFIPTDKEKMNEENQKLAKEEIASMVSKEIEGIRGHVDDVIDEALEYAVEKTERSLERLSNEKIMAVNEYSDTVLNEIHKNHEEVMFLYDMLNDKHTNLKNTVSEADKKVKEVKETTAKAEDTVKEVKETKKDAEEVVETFKKLSPVEVFPGLDAIPVVAAPAPKPQSAPKRRTTGNRGVNAGNRLPEYAAESVIPNIIDEIPQNKANSNEKILELHKKGKSNVAIAKELGLGVGEVKLVIDLYKQ